MVSKRSRAILYPVPLKTTGPQESQDVKRYLVLLAALLALGCQVQPAPEAPTTQLVRVVYDGSWLLGATMYDSSGQPASVFWMQGWGNQDLSFDRIPPSYHVGVDRLDAASSHTTLVVRIVDVCQGNERVLDEFSTDDEGLVFDIKN